MEAKQFLRGRRRRFPAWARRRAKWRRVPTLSGCWASKWMKRSSGDIPIDFVGLTYLLGRERELISLALSSWWENLNLCSSRASSCFPLRFPADRPRGRYPRWWLAISKHKSSRANGKSLKREFQSCGTKYLNLESCLGRFVPFLLSRGRAAAAGFVDYAPKSFSFMRSSDY